MADEKKKKKRIKVKRSLGLQGKDLDYGTPEGSMSLFVCLSVCLSWTKKQNTPSLFLSSIYFSGTSLVSWVLLLPADTVVLDSDP